MKKMPLERYKQCTMRSHEENKVLAVRGFMMVLHLISAIMDT